MTIRSIITLCLALLLGLTAAACAEVEINETNFPGEGFREFIGRFDDDSDGVLSDAEIAGLTDLALFDLDDVTGLNYLTNIEWLNLSGCDLTELDVSGLSRLKTLFVNDNRLTELDISHNPRLDDLQCENNALTSLDVSANNRLKYLYCSGNRLEALDISKNSALEELDCSDNRISALDLTGKPDLVEVSCSGNALSALDVSQNPGLVLLRSQGNPALMRLDLTGCLRLIAAYVGGDREAGEGFISYNSEIHDARLSVGSETAVVYEVDGDGVSIDSASFPDESFRAFVAQTLDLNGDNALSGWERDTCQSIDVSGKRIADLTGIDAFPQLRILDCSDNLLTALDVSRNPELLELYCGNNQIADLTLGEQVCLQDWVLSPNPLTRLDVRQVPHMLGCLTADGIDDWFRQWDHDVEMTGLTLPLTEIWLPENIQVIDQQAMAGVSADIVRFHDEFRGTIASEAFANCPNLKIVDIYDCHPGFIADDAFKGVGPNTYFYADGENAEWPHAHGYKTFENY